MYTQKILCARYCVCSSQCTHIGDILQGLSKGLVIIYVLGGASLLFLRFQTQNYDPPPFPPTQCWKIEVQLSRFESVTNLSQKFTNLNILFLWISLRMKNQTFGLMLSPEQYHNYLRQNMGWIKSYVWFNFVQNIPISGLA